MPPLLWFSAPLQPKSPQLMTLRAQNKCQPNAGKTLNEEPNAWKNKEVFQEGDLLSIIIYELASSYFKRMA